MPGGKCHVGGQGDGRTAEHGAEAAVTAVSPQWSSRLRILPVAVIGSSSRNSTIRGYL